MTVATLITVAALPALWLMQRDSSTPGSGGVAAAGPGGGIVISGSADEATTSTVAASTTATGPSVTLVTPASDAAVTEGQVVGSTIPVDHRVSGTATYKRYTGYGTSNPCMAPRAPINSEITVHSQNTGRSITCMNVVSYTELPDPQVVVVINTETFLHMADTRDAPVFVEITW